MERRLSNYLRTNRRRVGLTQLELGIVLGYKNEGAVSRHERVRSVPPLVTALSYEIVFRVPVSEMFAGLRDDIEGDIEARLAALEENLQNCSARDRNAIAIARKLEWLSERRSPEYKVAGQ
jgi:DNA-binding XRE family transcriptional regulator